MDVDPHSIAVLGVHWQQDVVTREGAFGDFFGEMVERTVVVERPAGVLASAREQDVPVFYTRVCFSERHPELIANCPLFDLVGQARCLVDGTSGAAIVPELSPQPGDVVVDHVRVTGAYGADLVEQLRARDVGSVAVFGVATNVSVEGAARGLADAGFDVYVVADCCAAATQEAHDASIETLGLLTRGIVSADDLTAAFGTEVTA